MDEVKVVTELRLKNLIYESYEGNEDLNTIFSFLNNVLNSGIDCVGHTLIEVDDSKNSIKKLMVQVFDLERFNTFKKKDVLLYSCLTLDYVGKIENIADAILKINLYAKKNDIKLSNNTYLLIQNNIQDFLHIKIYKECK
ncbi:hypothetical protein [Faecalitalea cylindroides]|uniref:Uncharacterized protein n=1 Tax=Faecalitalea cylindroides ATCC 27803 TaxID=649755 RepID=U2QZR8_9FIRM|nr:hypothetical protein [Faecalitalea cylindroides]ERK46813.1 hypothetical protein HMPREF0367_00362 [[Eubacterium] cylindroides ATCC 27803] [Faecalitalea cylindroides ATCC 27803]